MKSTILVSSLTIIAVSLGMSVSAAFGQTQASQAVTQIPVEQQDVVGIPDGYVGENYIQLSNGIVRDMTDGFYKTTLPGCADCFLGPGQWRFKAWVDQGITFGSSRSDETFTPQAYNDMYNTYQMNQAYLVLERKVAENGTNFSLGGRVDFFGGTDYYYTQAYGLDANNVGYLTTANDVEGRINGWNADGSRHLAQNVAYYGISLPQAYLELYMPILYGMKFKVGHFYSGMSMESPMAPENFFYSHNYTSYYGTPTTLTGFQLSANLGGLEIFGGMDFGWNRFSTKSDNLSGFGGVKWTNACKTFETQLMVHTGSETWTYENTAVRPISVDNANFNVTVLSWLTKWQFNPCWSTTLEYVYGWDNKGNFIRPGIAYNSSNWMGLTNAWYYRMTEKLTAGFRFEWFRDNPQCGRIPYTYYTSSTCCNVYDISLGLNWKPTYWCTIRPEVRWDWADMEADDITGGKFFGDSNSQFTYGMDLLLTF